MHWIPCLIIVLFALGLSHTVSKDRYQGNGKIDRWPSDNNES